mmetsp:Transcript_49579/g.98698  ORF Transcript_49579/g.98698 Transcript_49579/m.98698 type:complete len:85 (-) Transcript_49579:753-1007(-)
MRSMQKPPNNDEGRLRYKMRMVLSSRSPHNYAQTSGARQARRAADARLAILMRWRRVDPGNICSAPCDGRHGRLTRQRPPEATR